MKARETALRLKRFELDEKARKVADLEHMIHEFETIATDLGRQIKAEEDRSGIKDPSHFAYSTFAKSAAQRRENLQSSIAGLRTKLEAAAADYNEMKQQLERASGDLPREQTRPAGRRQERVSAYASRGA